MVIQAVATSHPQLPRLPVVDYTLVLALTPSLTVGLALGVLVNAAISQWLLNLLIIAIWTWSSIRLCFSYRAARTYEKHQQQQQEQQVEVEGHQQQAQKLQQQQQEELQEHEAVVVTADGIPATSPAAASFQLVICCDVDSAGADSSYPASQGLAVLKAMCNRVRSTSTTAAAAVQTWASYQPWWTIAAAGALFAFFIACQVIQGRLTPMCSGSYWAITGLLCGVGMAAAAAVSWWLLRAEVGRSPAVVALPGDATGSKKLSKLPQTSMAVNLAVAAVSLALRDSDGTGNVHDTSSSNAEALQLSGGSVARWTPGVLASIHIQMLVAGLMLGAWPLSPIILAIPGMHPQVGAGTSKLMLFMITAGAGLSFIAAGNINMSYLLVYGLVNAVATPLGVWLVDWIIKRTGRASCIIMLTVVRLMVCVVLQAALQALPSLFALAHGLPRAGFLAQPLCHSRARG